MEITNEVHRELAKALNGEVWDLLGNANRNREDDLRMIHTAHASLYHWLHAGTGVHAQRGEWLVANVYNTLGYGQAALLHAKRCKDLTEQYQDELRDFDRAYAYEALARAYAVLGNKDQAARYKVEARRLGGQIADAEDKQIFTNDFESGNWYGVD